MAREADITRNDPAQTLTSYGMTVVLASVIAVLGTLGGATASYLFQGKISERNESKARDERLRQERLAAYSSFAGAVMDLRGIQYDRGLQPHDRGGPPARSVKYPSGVLPASIGCVDCLLPVQTDVAGPATHQSRHTGRRGGFRRRRR